MRRTLEAAGIRLSEIDAAAGAQEAKISAEIEIARARQKEVSEKTQEAVRSLEEEISKVREACQSVMLYEERNISRATATLEELRRVRDLFGLPGAEGEEETGPDEQGTQQQEVYELFNVEQAQIFDTPLAEVFDISRRSEGSGEER